MTLWFAEPRGSKMQMRRRSSRTSSRCIILSNMVAPGTSKTPPVTTLPTSPSAWQLTTVNVLFQRMAYCSGKCAVSLMVATVIVESRAASITNQAGESGEPVALMSAMEIIGANPPNTALAMP